LVEAIIYSMAIDKVAALRATVLFGSLTNEELRALASPCTEHKLSREEVLFIAREEARGLYVVVSGAVRAFRAGADGREQVIHTERAGAILADVVRQKIIGFREATKVASKSDSTTKIRLLTA
jgi:signal-transduction protein with cAMP-binding, CBS, and nucleotidyltransferase domain